MAEVIGAIASGISIVQLSGQIAKNIIKLKGIWDQVKDAPEDISYLMKDLETLNTILHELEPQQTGAQIDFIAGSHAFRQSLALCQEGSRELNDLVESLSTQISSNKKFWKTRGSVKMIMKRDQIKRYKSRLKSSVTLLSLSHQCYSRAIAQNQFELLYSTFSRSLDPPILARPSTSRPHPKISEPIYPNLQSNNGAIISVGAHNSISLFDHPLVGSISVSQQPLQLAKTRDGGIPHPSGHKTLVRYIEPSWLSHKAWQLCCLRSQIGWTWRLTAHNIIPDHSPQFVYAQQGNLSHLQVMLANNEASIFDQARNGATLLSMAALYGQIDTCKWLLEQGAHTEHLRYGSILNMILYHGGWMSFSMNLPAFEIARLLQPKEDFDIFDCPDSVEGVCQFYGRKEMLSWLINLSLDRGYEHTAGDFMRLALNISRGIDHNTAELVGLALRNVPQQQILHAKDRDGNTILHRIAANLGASFAFEHQPGEHIPKFWDEGFEINHENFNTYLLPRRKWCSLLQTFNLHHADLNILSFQKDTPLTMGLRTIIGLWPGSTSNQLRAILSFLELWLSNLRSLGVCLLMYGQNEHLLLKNEHAGKNFPRHSRAKHPIRQSPRDYAHGLLRLIALEPNEHADKWKLWWSEPTDEFAGDFWAMLERTPPRIPGAWDDDEYS